MSVPSIPPLHPAFRPTPAVAPHAGHALGGIWRLALRPFFSPWHWLTVAGLLVLLGVFSFAMVPLRGGTDAFMPWAARFYVAFLVPLLAFVTAGGALRDDLQPGVIDYLFTRPLRRSHFIVFRFLAHVGVAQIHHTLALGLIFGLGLYRGVPGWGEALPLLLLGQMLMLVTFSAFGFLAGLLTSRYVIIGLVYGGIVEVALGNVPTALNRLSMSRHGLGILQPLLGPAHDTAKSALNALPFSPPATVALLLGVAAALLGLTVFLFQLREFAGSAARDA